MCDACRALQDLVVSDEEINLAVERGSGLLDREKEDWFTPQCLDTGTLDLININNCVLGQNYEGYYNGLSVLDLRGEGACINGFSLPGRATGESWTRLTAAWIAVVDKRREALVAA